MSKAILLQSDDWEMLYIDGKLKSEGHTLNQGESRIKCFLELSKKYDFDLSEMEEISMDEEDEAELEEPGSGQDLLSDYKGNYANRY